MKKLVRYPLFSPRKKSLKQLLFLLFLVILLVEITVMSIVIRITHNSISREAIKTSEQLLEYYSNQLENQMDFAQKDLQILLVFFLLKKQDSPIIHGLANSISK